MRDHAPPVRIHLRRVKGWRMPPNTVSVARPGPFGNPFVVGRHGDAAQCIARFRDLLTGLVSMFPPCPSYVDQATARDVILARLPSLRGKNLACWCPIDCPCHADILLKLANKTGIGPCEKCGSDDDCRCGPCRCKWCRYDRGEATEYEAAAIRRHLQARDRPILKKEADNG